MIKYAIIVFGLFYCAFAKGDVRDSVDNVAYERQLIRANNIPENAPYIWDEKDKQRLINKLKIKGSWRWDSDEFYSMFRFGRLIPEYYYDEDLKVSNGGWILS